MTRTKAPLKDRLLRRIEIDENGCWIWQGKVTKSGYGAIGLGGSILGLGMTHRVSYEIFKGQIPDGLNVCHRCDVKKCCNPSHLFVGTQKDNMEDMKNKGRGAIGVRHGLSKLTESKVKKIRDAYKAGNVSQKKLADRFGVSQSMVCKIVNRINWVHL